MLELYEIVNHVMLSQVNNSFADNLDLPHLYQNDENFGVAVQHDACLSKWEKSLPLSLRLDVSQGNTEDVLYRQALILRLR
jgi:hypothetical protein